MSSRRNAKESDKDETSSASPSPSSSPSAAAALEGMAEAIEKGAHLPSVDERIKHALECPCVKPLRDTSCREEFDLALTCFMKADEETRASDCATGSWRCTSAWLSIARSLRNSRRSW